MNRMKTRAMLFVGLGLLGGMVQRAAADDFDQKTVFTFSGPVEIPGQVLSAGTYVFKLADSSSDRNIVQVFNKDETHLYGTFLAIPDYPTIGITMPCLVTRDTLRKPAASKRAAAQASNHSKYLG
jgi:hypothetical protein